MMPCAHAQRPGNAARRSNACQRRRIDPVPASFGHYAETQRCVRLHLTIGIPAVALSAMAGTTVFASLSPNTNLGTPLKFAIATTSVVAAVLTALQTLLRFSGKSGSASECGKPIFVFPDTVNLEVIDVIRKELDELAARAPDISHAIWSKVSASIGEDYFLSEHFSSPSDDPVQKQASDP